MSAQKPARHKGMTLSILIETLLYYIGAGVFCGVVFTEELGLPMTRENDKGFRQNITKLTKSVGKYSVLWLPLVVVKTMSLFKD